MFSGDGGIELGLEAAGFVFDGFEAFTGGGEFGLDRLAGVGGGGFAFVKFGALPADVFDAGVEVFDFLGGEGELALEGGEFDFLFLEAFA